MSEGNVTEPTPGRLRRLHPEPARACPEFPGLPLLGHLLDVRCEGLRRVLERGWRAHGDVFRMRIGPQRMVVIAHPDAFERVLASHWRNFPKGHVYAPVRELLGEGLVTMDGNAWRERRRLVQPFFHRAELEKLVGTMVEVIDGRLAELERRHPEGGVLDVHHLMVELTFDVVCNALFGSGVMQSGDVSHETLAESTEAMEARLSHPFPLSVPTPTNLRFKRTRRAVDSMIFAAISRARRNRLSGSEEPTLLGMLLDVVDDEGKKLDDQDLRNEVATLIVAGHETTALAMTWMFALLDGNDGVMARLRAESDAVLGNRLPRFEHLSALVYARQVLQEVLRLRPPVPYLPRLAVEADNLCGHRIGAGEMVMLFYWGLHHHPAYWPRPETFDPDRFAPDAMTQRDSWAYLPFNGGPRTCIGNGFALFEGQLIASMMLQRATWTVVPGQHFTPRASGTLSPAAGVRVRFEWRRE